MSVNIGFIGTGIMGAPMVRCLLRAGHAVQVWNRSLDKARELQADGAVLSASAAAAAQGAQVLICMLSDGPTCTEVLFGPQGAALALAPGALLVVMSSIPVETAADHAQRCSELGLHYLDAPVSGGERGAKEGSLAIMVGGSAEAFALGQPLLAAMGRPVLVGPAGSGELAKLVNQLIVASTIAAVAEGLLFAERGGADPAKVREALLGGFVDSTILRQHGLRMIDADFKPGGPAKWQLKDTRTALAHARTLGLDLPVGNLVDGLFADMVDAGDGDLDHSGLIRQLRRRNGLPQ